MQIEMKDIPGVAMVSPVRHGDARGFFMETWRQDTFARAGINDEFVQDNQSFSASIGTVRGLHYQRAPHAQSKLVRVLQGRILDVVVDLRRSSPAYGRHVMIELDAESGKSLYVPIGCAHGFCTLTPDCLVSYKCSSYYAAAAEGGLLWNDPELGIVWPVTAKLAILSDKDKTWPTLSASGPVFP
jgi:dTDP-4-dehydrorhamnose 3,5-epimerase